MAQRRAANRQRDSPCEVHQTNRQIQETDMKLAITLSTSEPETAFNALRLGNYARAQGDEVGVFLVGAGVDLEKAADPRFDVVGQARKLQEAGGQIMACGTCLKLRESQGSEVCPLSTMKDLYTLIRDADRVVSF